MEPGGWRVGICDISYSFLTKDCESRHFFTKFTQNVLSRFKKARWRATEWNKTQLVRGIFLKTEHKEKTLKNSMIFLFGVAISTIGREPTQ